MVEAKQQTECINTIWTSDEREQVYANLSTQKLKMKRKELHARHSFYFFLSFIHSASFSVA